MWRAVRGDVRRRSDRARRRVHEEARLHHGRRRRRQLPAGRQAGHGAAVRATGLPTSLVHHRLVSGTQPPALSLSLHLFIYLTNVTYIVL